MFLNAYALFFLSVLIGAAAALHLLWRAHAAEVLAVLRGVEPLFINAPARARYARFRSGRRPAFPPIRFNTCRL